MDSSVLVSVVDTLVDDLRERIFSGALRPGEAVTEASLVARHGVSRPTAKAAIEQVVAQGLLVQSLHRSARVPELSPAEVLDIYQARLAIEVSAVRSLALRHRVPHPLRMAQQDIVELSSRGGAALIEPDMRFHSLLVQAYGSPKLARIYSGLAGDMRLCMAQVHGRPLLSPEIIITEHERLMNAISAGDPDRAERILTGHLHGAADRLAGSID